MASVLVHDVLESIVLLANQILARHLDIVKRDKAAQSVRIIPRHIDCTLFPIPRRLASSLCDR